MLRYSEAYGWPPDHDVDFRFSKHENLSSNVNRLLQGQIQHAINCLHTAVDPERGVHACRVAAKRIESVLLLLGDRPKVTSLSKQTLAFHKMLSKHRDSTVLRSRIAHLPRSKDQKNALANLDASRADLYAGFSSKTKPILLEHLELMGSIAGRITVPNTFNHLVPGLRECYAKARLGVSSAKGASRPSAKKLHHWRTHVKQHGFHLELLIPCAPVYLEPRLLAVNHLGRCLGDYHDLELTRHKVSKSKARARLAAQQECLLVDSFALQRWAMQPKPEPFMAELAQRWHQWNSFS